MIRSSFGRLPHQRGFLVSVIVLATGSIVSTANGPALTGRLVRQAVLNACAVEVSAAGRNGLNRLRHSAYRLSKVITACRSSTPLVTELIASYPVVPAARKAGSVPLLECQYAAKSRQVIGVPSVQVALGLRV